MTRYQPPRKRHHQEGDIYNFIRKLHLTYNFRDSTYKDKSIVKNESSFTPKNNENQELETICRHKN